MADSTVARDLTAVIAEEIEAQLGAHRQVADMPGLIADAILDAFQVQLIISPLKAARQADVRPIGDTPLASA